MNAHIRIGAILTALIMIALQTPVISAQPKDTVFYQDVSWLPDGSKLFLSRLDIGGTNYLYRIYSVNADGSNYTKLSNGPRDIWTSWSPSGTKFVFASKKENNNDIYARKLEGQYLLVSITSDSSNDTQPDMSPDGNQIALISDRSGTVQMYSMYLGSSHALKISSDSLTKDNPRWSPDGKWIAYYGRSESGNDSVYIIGADGKNKKTLCEGVWPSWSPNGKKILFTHDDDIYQIDTDGSNKQKVIDGAFYARWSPDGKKIAFIRTTWRSEKGWPSTSAVYVANSDGTSQLQIAPKSTDLGPFEL